MEGIPDAAVGELAAAVALGMPEPVGVVPPRPAAALGRLSRSAEVSAMAASEARRATTLLEKPRPGTAAPVETGTRKLVAHASIAPLLATLSGEDEHSLAGAHGAPDTWPSRSRRPPR